MEVEWTTSTEYVYNCTEGTITNINIYKRESRKCNGAISNE